MTLDFQQPPIGESRRPVNTRPESAIVADLRRYGLLTVDTAARLRNLNHEVAAATLRSLAERGLAHAAPLCGDMPYYRAAPRPLSPPVILQSLAMLACCLRTKVQRLAESELQRHWPTLLVGSRPARYYADHVTEPTLLGYLRVDAGGRGRWDRIVERVRQDIDRHAAEPCLAPLIGARRFEIAVLTPLPPKAARIAAALEQFPDAARARIRVLAMPELLSLIAPPALP